jgi:hypothetical protein
MTDPSPDELSQFQGRLLAEHYLARGVPTWGVEPMAELAARSARARFQRIPSEAHSRALLEGVRQVIDETAE